MISGCAIGPFHGSDKNYRSGNWWGYADTEEAADWESRQLAMKKLEQQPIDGTAVEGYRGVIANLTNDRINVKVVGPETKSYFLERRSAKDRQTLEYDRLVPGDYTAYAYKRGRQTGTWAFRVGAEEKRYLGEKLHWYLVVQ